MFEGGIAAAVSSSCGIVGSMFPLAAPKNVARASVQAAVRLRAVLLRLR